VTSKWTLLVSLSLGAAALGCSQPRPDVAGADSVVPPAGAAGAGAIATPSGDTAAAAAARPDTTDSFPLAQRLKGSPSAPVTVYEMSDFQCPFCRRFALETFPTLEREFVAGGKVKWIFVNFPLTQIHPNAVPTAAFALCAGRQDRFWPAHDLLYRQQEAWAELDDPAPYLLGLADSLELDRTALLACLQDPTTEAAVRRDAESAVRAGANSTPSFYIEGGLMAGAVPAEIFRVVLDSIVAAKTGSRRGS
jgi:protein-disulfide isomerase